MNEKDLNRILVKSINEIGFGYKISDEAANYYGTSKKPFDIIGVTNKFMIFGESKLIKGGLYAFNFKKIESHQIVALSKIKQSLQILSYQNAHTVISVGFWKSREFFYVMFFDILVITMGTRTSIKKKELEAIIESGKYLSIKKEHVIGIEDLSDKIIYDLSPYLL